MENNLLQDPEKKRDARKRVDLAWLPDELENLLFLVARAGMTATARDLRFAIRSAQVELAHRGGGTQVGSGGPLRFSRDESGQGS